MVSGVISSDNIGGPIMIVQVASSAASVGFQALFMFAGIMSTSLFVMNLLPIPALDGGAIFLLFLEWILGRPLPKKAENAIQAVGIAMLLGLMLFATNNDISRFFK